MELCVKISFNMQLHETDYQPQSVKEGVNDYFARFSSTVKNWEKLDDQTKYETIVYYGYNFLVFIGVPAAAITAFIARL